MLSDSASFIKPVRKQVDDNDWEIFTLHYKFLGTGHKYTDEGAGGQENFGVCHHFCAREKGWVKKREKHATYLGWVMDKKQKLQQKLQQ